MVFPRSTFIPFLDANLGYFSVCGDSNCVGDQLFFDSRMVSDFSIE
jgi:hypothetical protein